MQTGSNDSLRNRGILTRADREFLDGNRDVENPQHRRYELRSNVRKRVENLKRDLQYLREHGEDELADEVLNELSPQRRLEERVSRLEDRLGGEE